MLTKIGDVKYWIHLHLNEDSNSIGIFEIGKIFVSGHTDEIIRTALETAQLKREKTRSWTHQTRFVVQSLLLCGLHAQ